MADVPSQYINPLPVDYVAEIGSLLGRACDIGDDVTVPSPSVGTWSLLELLDSRTVKAPTRADPLDVIRTAYCLAHRRDALELVCRWAAAVKGRLPPVMAHPRTWEWLDHEAVRWSVKAFKPSHAPDLLKLCGVLSGCMTGFDMLPGGPGGGSLWLFAGEGLARVLRSCECLHLPPERVIWDVPMLLVGHLVAQSRHATGDSVSRPKDPADVRLQLRLCREREAAGSLHPWQIERPDVYRITPAQKAIRPDLEILHNLILRQYFEAKKRPAA